MGTRARQLWIDGVAQWCDHTVLAPIYSEGGKLLAEVCAACQLRIAEWGKCSGCGQVRRLTWFIASKSAAYHSEDCYQAAARAAALAKKTAPRKGPK